jgi:outer membrane lipoprotein-sorting protein
MIFRAIAILLAISFFSGCGSYETKSIIEDKKSYLSFSDSLKDADYKVNNSGWYKIEKTGVDEIYQIQSGKIHLQVRKDGRIIINRELLVNNGSVRNIEGP